MRTKLMQAYQALRELSESDDITNAECVILGQVRGMLVSKLTLEEWETMMSEIDPNY